MSLQANGFPCSQYNGKSLVLMINLIQPIPRAVFRTFILNPGNSSSVTVITKGATVPPQYSFGQRLLNQPVWKAAHPELAHRAFVPSC